jgi:SAM-dependent methyltransferase
MTEPHELRFETLTECPVCGWVDIPTIHRRVHYGIPANHAQCASCGQIFLNPRMTDEQTAAYYRGDYRDIMGGIQDDDLRRQEKRARYQVGAIGSWLDGRKRCLEIGCSAGYLLRALSAHGIECEGVEPDERYHEIEPARDHRLYASLDEVTGRYDLIAMSHVLEHINRPVEYMRRLIDDYTEPGALLMIEVPNIEIMPHFALIHHPVSYTADTLRALFHRLHCESLVMQRHDLGRAGDGMYLLGLFRRGEL